MTQTLTCIVAPDELLGVRESLRDWQAGGLTTDFVWMSAEAVAAGRMAGHLVSSGTLHPVDLRRMAGQAAYSRVRLGELIAADAHSPVSAAAGRSQPFGVDSPGAAVLSVVESNFGGAEISPLRVVLTGADGPGDTPAPQVVGWHYLVVSPEDTSSPGVGSAPIDSSRPGGLDTQRASQLAGLLGLWNGVAEAPLDSEEVGSLIRFRIVRGFHRRLSGDSTEQAVRSALLDVDSGYPRPDHEGGRCIYVENPAGAAQQAVSQLWEAYAHVLRGPRETLQLQQAKLIGVGQALKMLFSFLWASIVGAPAAWAVQVVRGFQTSVAASVQGFVFGSEQSAYQVVVAGRRADGLPAGWEDLQSAAKDLERSLPGSGQIEHEDLSGLWREYTNGALTLADGGVHGTVIRPLIVGSQTAVFRQPGDIVPDPDAAYPALTGALGATLGSQRLDAVDVAAIDEQGRRLQAESTRGTELSRESSAALGEMARWRESLARTYSSQFGARLADAIHAHRGELAALLKRLRDAAGSGEEEAALLREKQKRLGTIMRVLAIIAFLLLVTFAILGGVEVLSWTAALTIMAGTVVVWFVTALIVFVRGQRELFRIINRRRELETQAEVDVRNISAVVRDLTRATDAYAQYLKFTRALGHFLHHPFGVQHDPAEAAAGEFVDLPRSVAQGSIVADEDSIQESAMILQHSQFRTGWLDGQWRKFLTLAAGIVGPRGLELRDDPEMLFRVRADTDDLLDLWAAGLDGAPIPPTFGDAEWDVARNRLETDPGLESVRERLTGTVASIQGRSDRQRFLGSIGTAAADSIGQSLLDDTALAQNASWTQSDFIRSQDLGLGHTVVHVQMTGPIEAQSLGFGRPGSVADDTTDDRRRSTETYAQPFGDAAF